MTCTFPVWVHLARKTPVRAALRGQVFDIGAPERTDSGVLLTVWSQGRPVGDVLATDPPVFRRRASAASEPQPVSGIADLLELATHAHPAGVAGRRAVGD